jgi:hypothetical protein
MARFPFLNGSSSTLESSLESSWDESSLGGKESDAG